MNVATYLRHRVLYWIRHPSHGGGNLSGQVVLILMLLFVMTLFVYGPLAAVGWFLPEVVADMDTRKTALEVANAWFLWGFVALIPIRFLLHSPTRSATPAYLTLPLSQRPLVHTRLALDLLSLHTLVPLSIGVPVIFRVIAPSLSLLDTAAWAVSLLAATAAYTYAGIFLNETFGRRSRLFWSVAGGSGLLFAVDGWISVDVFLPLSSALMSNPLLSALALLGVAAVLYTALFQIRQHTYNRSTDAANNQITSEWVTQAISWIGTFGATGQATALELRLMVRHRRTRGMCLMLLVIGPLMCYAFAVTQDVTALMLTLQYVAMGIPFSYGVILFSGDHGHLEGLLARSSNPAILVQGKVRALQIMNTLLFILMGPALAFLSVQDVLFLIAWLPYALFVVAPLSAYFAASTSTPVDLSVSAFAPRSSSHHMIPLVLPLLIALGGALLYVTTDPWNGFAIPVVGGVIGALSTPALRRATTRKLEQRKYRLLHTFRSTEPT